ncbi:PTS IIA-like nitrogen regulatory protein PtsN [Kordiimonas aquimaris]|uniref:PTS IIA-like nitrogen regulatory protein PtsN n=1 Tax=Kordiimonas aquimaris TaxID=707591 RepID=UPI0021D1E547|nr:PTS IIA-like nitrogen regulatory protein PtsN [Kordiimonas aquimaris]
MNIEDLLAAEHVFADVKASSKKQILQTLSRKWAQLHGVDERLAFDKLLERERLGSTGVGRGIAIPHARIEGLENITGIFARLSTPTDFGSVDDLPVDLVFMMFAPEDAGADHLKALARVSRLLRDPTICDKLRQSTDAAAAYALLVHQPASYAA